MNKSKSKPAKYRNWEYAEKGDYHRNLDPNWSYTPTYLRKMDFIRKQIQSHGKESRILDAGCGEGVLVEEFRQKGYGVEGLDLNYESEIVRRGSVLDMPYEDCSFDVVLLLDVFEHLSYADQPKALSEIMRILGGGDDLLYPFLTWPIGIPDLGLQFLESSIGQTVS